MARRNPRLPLSPLKAHSASCAVIVTQFKINRNGDATPDDYARQALDTSGTWTGSGGSLETDLALDRHPHPLDTNCHAKHGRRNHQHAFRFKNALRGAMSKANPKCSLLPAPPLRSLQP